MKALFATLVLATGLWGTPAHAGEAGAALSECLKRSATPDDRRILVQWIFSAIAIHPDLQALSAIDNAQRAKIEKDAASTFELLVAVDCTVTARQTIVAEGTEGFGNAFKTLGELAMGGVVENRDVQVGMSRLGELVDSQRMLKALISK